MFVGTFNLLIPEVEGRFLSGYIEGECHLRVGENNGGQSASCSLVVRVRDDDRELLEWLVAATGLGRLQRASVGGNSAPQLGWHVVRRAECDELVRFLLRFPFLSRKRDELAIWSTAVGVWLTKPRGWLEEMLRLRHRLQAQRRYRPPGSEQVVLPTGLALRGFLAGFIAAEGSFHLSSTAAGMSVHLRGDDAPLLEALAGVTGLGTVCHHAGRGRENPSSTWQVRSQAHTQVLARWLLEVDLYGRKRAELDAWATGVEEIRLARATGRPKNVVVMNAARDALAEARAYAPVPDRPLFTLARPDIRERSVVALRRWAAETTGPLKCMDYARWQRGQAGAPTRNSVAGAMGSWHGALVAADLEDRAAREPRRAEATSAGFGPFSDRGRQLQRARVFAGLARYEQENGALPGITDFMRWRLRTGADVPSHATLYRAFGGGWDTVLAAYRCRSSA